MGMWNVDGFCFKWLVDSFVDAGQAILRAIFGAASAQLVGETRTLRVQVPDNPILSKILTFITTTTKASILSCGHFGHLG